MKTEIALKKQKILCHFFNDETVIPDLCIGNFNAQSYKTKSLLNTFNFKETVVLDNHEFNEVADADLFSTVQLKTAFFNEAKKRWQRRKIQAIEEFLRNPDWRGYVIRQLPGENSVRIRLQIPNHDELIHKADIQNDSLFEKLWQEIEDRIIYDQCDERQSEFVKNFGQEAAKLKIIREKYCEVDKKSLAYDAFINQATENLLVIDFFRDYVVLEDFERFSKFKYLRLARLVYDAVHELYQFKEIQEIKNLIKRKPIPTKLILAVDQAKISNKPARLKVLLYLYFTEQHFRDDKGRRLSLTYLAKQKTSDPRIRAVEVWAELAQSSNFSSKNNPLENL